MHKRIKILAVLLIAQLALAAVIGLTKRESTASDSIPLLSFTDEKINGITLDGPGDAKVILARKGGAWVLPDLWDFPANGRRVEQLIEQLGTLRSGTPVATSSGARERFKVSDELFERRITLSQDGTTVAQLYLGSSPGMRFVHARDGEGNAIYAVKMAAYDVPVKAADWEDKSILTLPKSTIIAIEVDDLRIERSPANSSKEKKADGSSPSPAWQADGLAVGKRLKSEAVDKLVGLLADLRFDRVLGQEVKEEYGMENPVIKISLHQNGDEALTYRLGKTKGKDEYTLKVSSRKEYFRLASYKAKPLIEAANEEKITESIPDASEQEMETEQTPNH